MLVFALVAHRMTTLVEFVSRGYDDAKSAAQNLQGRATYEKQVGNACARVRAQERTLSPHSLGLSSEGEALGINLTRSLSPPSIFRASIGGRIVSVGQGRSLRVRVHEGWAVHLSRRRNNIIQGRGAERLPFGYQVSALP